MNVRFKFPAGGQVIRVPLTISIPDYKTIEDLENLDMLITAKDHLPITLGIEVLCDSILSYILSPDNVQASLAISLNKLRDELILRAKDNVPAWVRVNAEITEAIGMILNAYRSDANLAIDLVGESIFENGMTITAKDAVDMLKHTYPEIAENAEMILSARDNVVIESIRQSLGELNNKMIIREGCRITLIGDLDPMQTGALDPDVVPDITLEPIQPHLEVGIIEDGDGEVSLAIRACDDVRAVKTEPVKIAHIDPNRLGELDDDPVPDGRTV